MAMGTMGRVAGCALASLQVFACYAPSAYDDFLTAADDYTTSSTSGGEGSESTLLTSTVSGVGSSGSSGEDATTGGGTGSGGDDTGAQVDMPPEIVKVTINGAEGPAAIDVASQIDFAATAIDDHEVASVEFMVDGVSIGVDSEAPFTASMLVYSDTWNGDHKVTVIARDGADQSDTEERELAIMLPVSGSVKWDWSDQTYSGGALDVAVGPDGSVYVAGLRRYGLDPNLTRVDVRKFSADLGGELWARTYPSKDAPKGANIGYGVGVDVNGNVLVVGDVDLDGSSTRSVLLTYTADGGEVGPKLGQLGDHARDIAVGPGGAFVIAGFREKQISSDAMFWGYTAIGEPDWTVKFHPEWTTKNIANGVVIGADGKMFAGGVMTDANDVEYGFVLQVKEGSHGWYRSTSMVDSLDDVGHDVALDRDGNVVLVGQRKKKGDELWMVRVDAVTGDMLGSFDDPSLRCGSIGCGIASDGAGNLLIAGAVSNLNTGVDTAVKKIDDTWVATYWQSLSAGFDKSGEDRSVAVATGPFGAVYAAGYQTRLGAPHLWLTRLNP